MIKYDLEIDKDIVISSLTRITNQIFRLLPLREEGGNWQAPLENLVVELAGLNRLLINQSNFFSLLSKMEGMLTLTEEKDFFLFRKNVFECLSILTNIRSELEN